MNSTAVRAAGVGALAVAGLALSALPAQAARPEVFVLHVDDTYPSRTSEDCGFDILAHVEGTMRFTDFVDSAGDPVRSLVTYPRLTYTFTNVETGESVTSRSPDPEHYTWNADGSFILTVTGLVLHWLVPGQGVAGQAGRFTITVDPDGNVSESEPVGQADDYHAALCQILAP